MPYIRSPDENDPFVVLQLILTKVKIKEVRKMKRRAMLSWLVLITLLVTAVMPVHGADKTPNNYVKIRLDKNYEPLNFTSDEFSKLPGEAQKFIKSNKDPLIASVATIHVIKKTKDNKGIVAASKDYDFSKKEDITIYQNDIKKLKGKKLSDLKGFNMIQPAEEDEHGGYIITGLNVSEVSSSHDVEFQLQGYWEWETTMLVSAYDRVGLGWTDWFSSTQSSQLAFGNRYYDGRSITLTKHSYTDPGCFNKGVIWRHNSAYQTYGNTLARIYNNNIGPKEVGMWFEYVAPGGPTSDDSWIINVADMIISYFGFPSPGGIQHFQTFVTRDI